MTSNVAQVSREAREERTFLNHEESYKTLFTKEKSGTKLTPQDSENLGTAQNALLKAGYLFETTDGQHALVRPTAISGKKIVLIPTSKKPAVTDTSTRATPKKVFRHKAPKKTKTPVEKKTTRTWGQFLKQTGTSTLKGFGSFLASTSITFLGAEVTNNLPMGLILGSIATAGAYLSKQLSPKESIVPVIGLALAASATETEMPISEGLIASALDISLVALANYFQTSTSKSSEESKLTNSQILPGTTALFSEPEESEDEQEQVTAAELSQKTRTELATNNNSSTAITSDVEEE